MIVLAFGTGLSVFGLLLVIFVGLVIWRVVR